MSQRKTIEVKIKEYSSYEILDILDGMSPQDLIDTMESICEAYPERNLFFVINSYNSCVELWETRLETDKEYQKRLDAEAAITNKARAAKLKKKEKERKEYERLKKRFEKK